MTQQQSTSTQQPRTNRDGSVSRIQGMPFTATKVTVSSNR